MEHVDNLAVFTMHQTTPAILSGYMVKLSQCFLLSFSSSDKVSVLFFKPHIFFSAFLFRFKRSTSFSVQLVPAKKSMARL